MTDLRNDLALTRRRLQRGFLLNPFRFGSGGPPMPDIDWWRTLLGMEFSMENGGWNGHTARLSFWPGVLSGSGFRFTLKAGPTYATSFSKVFAQLGTNTFDFVSSPLEVKFSGSSGATLAAGASITSDIVPVTVTASDYLVLSMHSTSSNQPSIGLITPLFCKLQVQYIAGDYAGDLSISGASITGINGQLALAEVSAGQVNPEWHDLWCGNHGESSSSWNGYTVRVVVPKAQLPSSFSLAKVMAIIGSRFDDPDQTYSIRIFAGLSAGSPKYAFDSAPTELKFGGSSGYSGRGNLFVESDSGSVISDGTKDLVLAFYLSYNTGIVGAYLPSGWLSYYKSGNDASTVAASGYSSYSEFPSICRVSVR